MDRRVFLKTCALFLLAKGVSANGNIRFLEAPAKASPNVELDANHQRPTASGDVRLLDADKPIFQSVLSRFSRIQATVGYGNFCLLGFDESLKIARSYPRVGRFTQRELAFLEKVFHTDARTYGFLGNKTFNKLTDTVAASTAKKIPGTGNYLFKGRSQTLYHRIKKDIGDQVVLTAGIRGMAKQIYLFLGKVSRTDGNLSLAAHALAPPGYSYHGVGDFDVGQVGFGVANFTERFSQTRVYQKISQLDYIVFRYPRRNGVGVQFEPWHIQVV